MKRGERFTAVVLRDVFRRQLSIGPNPSPGSGNPASAPSPAAPALRLRKAPGAGASPATQGARRATLEGTVRETVTLTPPLASLTLPGWPGMEPPGVELNWWTEPSDGPDPSGGPWRVEITLSPPQLGPLTITLWNRGDRLDVQVACERTETAEEVARHLPELAEALAKTFDVGGVQALRRPAAGDAGAPQPGGPAPDTRAVDVSL